MAVNRLISPVRCSSLHAAQNFLIIRSTRNRQAGRQAVEYAAINKAINRLQSGAIDIVRMQRLAPFFTPSLHS